MTQGLRIDGADVAIDQDEIGPFADIETAELRFRKASIGRAAREAGKRLFEADALIRDPAARRLAVRILAASDAGLRDAMVRFQAELADAARAKGKVVKDATRSKGDA